VTRPMSFVSKTLAVVQKDARTELRSRQALNSVLLFCVTCVLVVSFALKGTVDDSRIVSALLWVILFFSAMTGLSRTFIKEHDQGTMNTLRMACDPGPLFLGKSLVNFFLLAAVIFIVAPLFCILMNVSIPHPEFFVISAALASLGMSAVCTLISGLVSEAQGRGVLYPVLAFPVLLPVFWVAVDATDRALSAPSPWVHANLLAFLASYAGAAFIGGEYLFEYIFRE